LCGNWYFLNDCFTSSPEKVDWIPMLAPVLTLLFVLPFPNADSTASRQIAAPCQAVEGKAIQYFEEHDFYTKTQTEGDDIVVDLGNHKDASTPSAKPLSLNRHSIHKYTLPRHLSPAKSYADFRVEGHLRLVKAAEASCNVTLRFDISAYEWVWSLAAIDDGYRSNFISNGTLEKLYIDPIAEAFTEAKH
jgi:hypothetical protein